MVMLLTISFLIEDKFPLPECNYRSGECQAAGAKRFGSQGKVGEEWVTGWVTVD